MPQRGNDLIGELLRGDITNGQVRPPVRNGIADGIDEVRFPEPDPSIDKQGIIGKPRVLPHPLGSGMGELVGRTHYKSIEGIPRVEVTPPARKPVLPVFHPGVQLAEGSVFLFCGLELHNYLIPKELFRRFGNKGRIAVLHPLAVEPVGDLEGEDPVLEAEEPHGLEPELKKILPHLFRNSSKALIPEFLSI